MYRSSVFLTACVFAVLALTPHQQADYESLLTIKDVEDVSGMQGVKLVPRNPQVGAGGELNFALADGTLLLMVGVSAGRGGSMIHHKSLVSKISAKCGLAKKYK